MIDAVEFLARCFEHEGKPYVWSAKGPDSFDCSGLVTHALAASGAPEFQDGHHNCQRLWEKLEPTTTPQAGDLVFYGPPHRVSHVMVYMGATDGRVFGACGGNSSTTSVEVAKKQNARVKFRWAVSYRPDFKGYRMLP